VVKTGKRSLSFDLFDNTISNWNIGLSRLAHLPLVSKLVSRKVGLTVFISNDSKTSFSSYNLKYSYSNLPLVYFSASFDVEFAVLNTQQIEHPLDLCLDSSYGVFSDTLCYPFTESSGW
jgi:hypothetical protein